MPLRESTGAPPRVLICMPCSSSSSSPQLKRVDSEVGAQRTLRHRGILQVHDVVNGRYGLYVVMDKVRPTTCQFRAFFLPSLPKHVVAALLLILVGMASQIPYPQPPPPQGGKDLFDFFDEQGDCISEANCRVLARSVVDAVAFCHRRGICHRDLKPENILLNCPRDQPVKVRKAELVLLLRRLRLLLMRCTLCGERRSRTLTTTTTTAGPHGPQPLPGQALRLRPLLAVCPRSDAEGLLRQPRLLRAGDDHRPGLRRPRRRLLEPRVRAENVCVCARLECGRRPRSRLAMRWYFPLTPWTKSTTAASSWSWPWGTTSSAMSGWPPTTTSSCRTPAGSRPRSASAWRPSAAPCGRSSASTRSSSTSSWASSLSSRRSGAWINVA